LNQSKCAVQTDSNTAMNLTL